MTSANPAANDVNTIQVTRRCGLCGLGGHNMTTCIRLRFHQNQAHRLYVHMWQRWLETFSATLEPRFFDDNPSDYLDYANMLSLENDRWINQPRNFRLLKSYLNLSGRGTEQEIRLYIAGLYHYLVMKKNGFYDENSIYHDVAQNTTDKYAYYDYLLETIPISRVVLTRRDYGIIVESKSFKDALRIRDEDLGGLCSCPICYEDFPCTALVKTNCSHSFCETCVINTIKILPDNKNLSCAMCRSDIHHLSCYTLQTNTNLKNILNINL
jgi:hypothetical protein